MTTRQKRFSTCTWVLFLLAFLVMLLPWSLPEVFAPGPEDYSVAYTSFLDFRHIGFADFLPPLCFMAFAAWVLVTLSAWQQGRPVSWAGPVFGVLAVVFAVCRIFWFSFSIVFPWGVTAIALLLGAALIVQIIGKLVK